MATAGYPTESVKCPPGHYCLDGTKHAFQHPCPNGKFSRNIGNERADQCEFCNPGYYCMGGDTTGDKLCPAGHYCIQGTPDPKKYPCDAGMYTEERGATCKHFIIYLFICLFLSLFICLFICLFVYLFICLFVYLFICYTLFNYKGNICICFERLDSIF